MWASPFSLIQLLTFFNVAVSSVVVILAFSLLAYTLTYNFRDPVARRFALLLSCVMVVYAADVALNRVIGAHSANRWLRFQWLGIAMVPAAYYTFSNAVLRTTNYRTTRRRMISLAIYAISLASAASAIFGRQVVGAVHFEPPLSYLEAGPLFGLFALFFALAALLSLHNIWLARSRCLTENSRTRMTYLLLGFVAPGVGIFPYLIALGRLGSGSNILVLLLALFGNLAIAALLVVMSYTVAYFGVRMPDRVVRYRLLRFFMRGPVVAIVVILAIQTLPTVERIVGLPRDIILFSVITGVIVLSQLLLSITKTLVDALIYREDREEVAWLRELDRRLLTSSDLRQFLEHNLTAMCELLRVSSGFVAAVVGSELILESVVGPADARESLLQVGDWSGALRRSLALRGYRTVVHENPGVPIQEKANGLDAAHKADQEKTERAWMPIDHEGFWVWPLMELTAAEGPPRVLGLLGMRARTETTPFSPEEQAALGQMLEQIGSALGDRQLQQEVFVALRHIIPGIERIQRLRGIVPYPTDMGEEAVELATPNPVDDPEFTAWVKDALSHYWGGPKLTRSPLIQLQVVGRSVDDADGNLAKALRLVLGAAIDRLRPEGNPNLSAPEWLLYNILEMRFIQGHKVRDIAERLAMSESDLYRKQRVAIDQVAQVLADMEEDEMADLESPTDEAADLLALDRLPLRTR